MEWFDRNKFLYIVLGDVKHKAGVHYFAINPQNPIPYNSFIIQLILFTLYSLYIVAYTCAQCCPKTHKMPVTSHLGELFLQYNEHGLCN